MNGTQLATLAQVVDRHPWLGAASTTAPADDADDTRRRRGLRQLRWMIEHADSNGLAESGAIVRPTERRLLIDLDRFGGWLDSRRQTA